MDLRDDPRPVVVIQGNRFRPSRLVVRPGTEVVFQGDAAHDVIFTDGLTPSITRDDFAISSEWVRRFDTVGEHPFHCSLHGIPGKGMHGTVRVAG